MNSGIYQIINKANGKFYIGSTVNFRTRKNDHWFYLRRNQHDNQHLQRAWNKYGESNFIFQIVEYNEGNLLEREQQYLNCCVGQQNCYNMSINAIASMRGKKHTNETKQKISKIKKELGLKPMLGRKFTDEHKAKLKLSHLGLKNPNFGIPRSNSTKIKIGLKQKGSQNHRALLNEDDVKKIRELVLRQSCISIARLYNVHPATIVAIKNRKSWNHI